MILLAACAAPTTPDLLEPGELGLVQIDLRGERGESLLVVGPDGTRTLIDVGNDGHGPDVAAAVERWTGGPGVDATILTHFHEDHAAGLGSLPFDPGVIVSRGPVDLDVVAVPEGFDTAERVDLDGSEPWTLELGEGAALTVLAANGRVGTASFGPLPADDDGENARSLVGTVTWGDFTYLWSGDLTGGGKGTPDLESFYAEHLKLPPVTLLHLGHHGIDSSTQADWVAATAPRLAITGSNRGYLDAPADEVLDRLRTHGTQVWIPRGGALTGSDPILHEGGDDVVVAVSADGAVRVAAGDASATLP